MKMNRSKILTITPESPNAILIPDDRSRASKDHRSRLKLYMQWLDQHSLRWYQPDLAAYRDHLEAIGRENRTIAAALSTIRARYRVLLRDRDLFFNAMPENIPFLEQQAFVNEIITRIENAIHPDHIQISITQHQDIEDSKQLRLTTAQADSLLRQPKVNTLSGLRDLAVIALILCTGIRELEAVNLTVDDLRQHLGGELALRVQEGKGNKSRLVPYGELDWCLLIADRWLQFAGIMSGPVYRGFYKGNKRLRQNALTERAILDILNGYPISINGEKRTVKPHDLRRTYARRLYEAGVDLVAIQQNLGHANIKTTLEYIGPLDIDKRRARAVYHYDLNLLPESLI
jgi:site-specific recombinase XerD